LYLISFRFTFLLLTGKCSYPFAVNFKLQFVAQGDGKGEEGRCERGKKCRKYEL